MRKGKTTIQLTIEVKRELDKLRIHPREPLNDVISRLLEHYRESRRRAAPPQSTSS